MISDEQIKVVYNTSAFEKAQDPRLRALLQLQHTGPVMLYFMLTICFFNSSVYLDIKNAPPKIELFLSNFRGALQKTS